VLREWFGAFYGVHVVNSLLMATKLTAGHPPAGGWLPNAYPLKSRQDIHPIDAKDDWNMEPQPGWAPA